MRKLTEDEKKVLKLCQKATSKDPLTRANLKSVLGSCDANARQVIGDLREMGFRIISNGKGYWLATPEEYKEWLPTYVAYARTIERRVRKMDKYTDGQLRMALK